MLKINYSLAILLLSLVAINGAQFKSNDYFVGTNYEKNIETTVNGAHSKRENIDETQSTAEETVSEQDSFLPEATTAVALEIDEQIKSEDSSQEEVTATEFTTIAIIIEEQNSVSDGEFSTPTYEMKSLAQETSISENLKELTVTTSKILITTEYNENIVNSNDRKYSRGNTIFLIFVPFLLEFNRFIIKG